MALPNELGRAPQPAQSLRISIGETVPAAGGKTRPNKLDYFQMRSFSFGQKGSGSYLLNEHAQKELCDYIQRTLPATHPWAVGAAQGKPRVVPIKLLGNAFMQTYTDATGNEGQQWALPEVVAYTGMARFAGSRRLCYCDTFNALGQGTAVMRQSELRDGRKQGEKIEVRLPDKLISCNPGICGHATGETTADGKPDCKPQIVYQGMVPFIDEIGAVARFHSTGWKSGEALRSSLLLIASLTGGWLLDLPLWMVLSFTKGRQGNIPVVNFAFRGDPTMLRQLRDSTMDLWMGRGDERKALQAAVVQETTKLLRDPEQQAAWNEEFLPDTAASRRQVIPAATAVPSVAGACEEEEAVIGPPEVTEEIAEGEYEPDLTEPPAEPFDMTQDPLYEKTVTLLDALEATAKQQAGYFSRVTDADKLKRLHAWALGRYRH